MTSLEDESIPIPGQLLLLSQKPTKTHYKGYLQQHGAEYIPASSVSKKAKAKKPKIIARAQNVSSPKYDIRISMTGDTSEKQCLMQSNSGIIMQETPCYHTMQSVTASSS